MQGKIAGTALAVTLLLPTGALAAPGGEPGRPESKPNGPQGPAGNPGSDQAQEVRSDAEPQAPASKPAPKQRKVKLKAKPKAKPKPKAQPKPHGGEPGAPAPPSTPKAKAGKTTICHSTGSATNPYVEITVSDNALKAHARHHDGRDIIPAPAGGCPGSDAAAAAPDATDSDSAGGGGTQGSARTSFDAPADANEAAGEGTGGEGAVLGAEASSSPADTENASQAVAEEVDEGGGSLPFTGLGLLALLGVAVCALGGGVSTRRAG